MVGKAKHLAALSLGIMSAGYLATLPIHHQLLGSLLQGAFEAGLVGGLADWFAVTALFRHPLGLPIPHTALLPKNREKLTNAMIAAVENNLLNKKSIFDKIMQFHVTEHLLGHAAKEIQTDTAKSMIDTLCKRLIEDLSVEPILPFLEKAIKRQLNTIEIAPILESIVHEVASRGYDERAFDYVLDKAEQWILESESQERIGRVVTHALSGLRLNGFMQFTLNAFLGYLSEDKLGALIQQLAVSKIEELRMEGNPNREAIIARLRIEFNKLALNQSFVLGIANWKQQMIEAWPLTERLAQTIEDFRNAVQVFISDGGYVDTLIIPSLVRLIEQLQSDKSRLDIWEERIKEMLFKLIEKNHSRIGRLIRENIERMDNRALIAMLEENVGKDLQWIRVNGAICGFIFGLVLTGFRLLIG